MAPDHAISQRDNNPSQMSGHRLQRRGHELQPSNPHADPHADPPICAAGRISCAGRYRPPRLGDLGVRCGAVTALTATILLETGRDRDDPVVIALREELR